VQEFYRADELPKLQRVVVGEELTMLAMESPKKILYDANGWTTLHVYRDLAIKLHRGGHMYT
jgi:hypothetical protein